MQSFSSGFLHGAFPHLFKEVLFSSAVETSSGSLCSSLLKVSGTSRGSKVLLYFFN